MKAEYPKKLMATAYHEAGHAVAAIMLGIRFHSVTVQPDEAAGSLGHVLHADRFPARIIRRLEGSRSLISLPRIPEVVANRIVMTLAGEVAESSFTGRRNHVGARSDFRTAVNFAKTMHRSDSAAEKYIEYLREHAKSIFAFPKTFHGIGAIAQALCARTTLTAEETKKIWIESTQPKSTTGKK